MKMTLIRRTVFVTLMGLSLGLCHAGDSPLTATPKGWNIENANLILVLSRLARDFSAMTSPTIVIFEGWDDMQVSKPVKGTLGFTTEINKQAFRITINSDKKHYNNYKELLDDIASQHGSVMWQYDPQDNVIFFTEKHMAQDKRWLLNSELGANGEKDMTFQEAINLLADQFGLEFKKGWKFMLYDGDMNIVVWRHIEHKDKKARFLVASMTKQIMRIHKDLHFFLLSAGSINDYDTFKDKKELQWHGFPIFMLSDIQIEEMLKMSKAK